MGAVSVNFCKTYVRFYDLDTNKESNRWSNDLIINWGLTYWIKA